MAHRSPSTQIHVSGLKQEEPVDTLVENINDDIPGPEFRHIRRKIDIRVTLMLAFMYIANQLDRGNVSFAYVSGMEQELGYEGNFYTTMVSVYFPFYILAAPIATVLARKLGPRLFLSGITLSFGLIVIGFGLCKSWKDQVGLRAVLGLFEGCLFPSATFIISMYYIRREVATRIAVFYIVGLLFGGFGGLIAYGLKKMDGVDGKSGWRWIFIWEGIFTIVIAIIGWMWMVDFPEDAGKNFKFLKASELDLVIDRVRRDRGDAELTPFDLKSYLMHGLDWRLWFYALNFLASAVVTYTAQYFLPIILQDGLGFTNTYSLCLTAPVYVLACIMTLIQSWLSDRWHMRAPFLLFNGVVQLVGFALVGYAYQPYVRYFGTYLLLMGTASNTPICMAYQANNVVGQWRRAFSSAIIVGFGTVGGVAASLGFRTQDAPRYLPGIYMAFTAISLGILSACTTTVYMFLQNRKQAKGLVVIENTIGFRFTL